MNWDSTTEQRFILKLIKETQANNIVWESSSNRLELSAHESQQSKLYFAEINGSTFRLYEYQYPAFTDIDEWHWSNRIRLEKLDSNNHVDYEFEYDYSLYELFKVIRASNSGINDFMKSFLNE